VLTLDKAAAMCTSVWQELRRPRDCGARGGAAQRRCRRRRGGAGRASRCEMLSPTPRRGRRGAVVKLRVLRLGVKGTDASVPRWRGPGAKGALPGGSVPPRTPAPCRNVHSARRHARRAPHSLGDDGLVAVHVRHLRRVGGILGGLVLSHAHQPREPAPEPASARRRDGQADGQHAGRTAERSRARRPRARPPPCARARWRGPPPPPPTQPANKHSHNLQTNIRDAWACATPARPPVVRARRGARGADLWLEPDVGRVLGHRLKLVVGPATKARGAPQPGGGAGAARASAARVRPPPFSPARLPLRPPPAPPRERERERERESALSEG
jgi:hypothetical protein